MATGVSPDVETFAAAASAENLEQAANALRERGFDTHVVAEPNGDEYVASTDYKMEPLRSPVVANGGNHLEIGRGSKLAKTSGNRCRRLQPVATGPGW
jgi:hypothetical protein